MQAFPYIPKLKEGLYHVSQINWSDPSIHRASITPILIKGSKKLIGLGVTNATAVIVTIGGAFEAKDGDLLNTAVREYNEETGSSLNQNDVTDCYVLLNKGSVNILLPVLDRIEFKSNNELERILWLTTAQTAIISKRQNYDHQVGYTTVRILTMSQSLINELPLLLHAVNSGIPFVRRVLPFFFVRTYKAAEIKQTRVSTNFSQLRTDISDPSLFYGSSSMAARGDYVSFERRDKAIYALTSDNFDDLINIIRQHKIKVYVGFESEVETYGKLLGMQRLLSIEGRIRKFIKAGVSTEALQRLWEDFKNRIELYRKHPDVYSVTWETILIHETEEAIYRLTENVPFRNNGIRSSFFEALDLATMYVLTIAAIDSDVLLWELEDFLLERQKHKGIRPSDALNVMIKLGLLKLNGEVVNVV